MSRPTVLAMVGTDHHPFDRFVGWVDRWAAAHPEVDVFIQHGTAEPPRHAAGAATVEYRELAGRASAADVVVTHGGLSSIMEQRSAGRLPLIVARDPALGEHVDAHQQHFTAHEAAQGRIRLVATEVELHAELDAAVADPRHLELPAGAGDVSPAVERVAALVDELVARRRGRTVRRPLQEVPR